LIQRSAALVDIGNTIQTRLTCKRKIGG